MRLDLVIRILDLGRQRVGDGWWWRRRLIARIIGHQGCRQQRDEQRQAYEFGVTAIHDGNPPDAQ